ncbi:hypothetical protein M885DRAFT_531012 [Pelagophyceae sp. CCMP2097]|nr:hypothetical protein M885DRAFT_531012 [Pelagophyceae sp. CCMP2097]
MDFDDFDDDDMLTDLCLGERGGAPSDDDEEESDDADPFWRCASAGRDDAAAAERRSLAPDAEEEALRRVRPSAVRRRLRVTVADVELSLFPTVADADGVFGSTGGELWEASLLLAQFCRGGRFRGAHVVELGAGLGLGGLASAHASIGGARSCVLTDLDEAVLKNLEATVRENSLHFVARVDRLDWNDRRLPGGWGEVDAFVGAALVYTPHLGDALAATLASALTDSRRAFIIQRYDRPGFLDTFIPKLQEYGLFCDVRPAADAVGSVADAVVSEMEKFVLCTISRAPETNVLCPPGSVRQ